MTKQQPKLHRDQDPGTTQPEGNSTHLNYKFFFFFAGSFKSQLIDYSDLPRGYGEGLRGAFGSSMIIRPSLFKCDWSLFSIWNGVIVIN